MARDIREVKNLADLIGYFSTKLGWNIDLDDFEDIEDISYDFDAADIGIKEESFAKISSLRQLQPLVDGQQWGIFCVEFDSNRFEPSALKKILSGLIPRKRNSKDHAVWCQQDLLFICNWGTDNNSTIGLAHFEDREDGLPQIKMFSCAPALEDFTQIKLFEERLTQLAWPKNTSNIDEWREMWSSAFTLTYKQIIQDSSTLTVQLAAEAQNIRNRIIDILEVETKNGYVHLLYEKFRDTLIHDMTEQQFADMYAQTIVYGLFSARCLDQTQDDFSVMEAIELIPNTNPFLKTLLEECVGKESNNKLSFDELEIGNVVRILKNTRTDAIIQDFNRQTGGGREDPVIHFYEEFLTAYDKEQKVQRGVYYTPQPVVNFIVRAVDYIIKSEFGMEDGMASTETKIVKYKRDSLRKKDGLFRTQVEDKKEVPAIQILDPSTGTGTFLRQTILQVYEDFKIKNKRLNDDELNKAWNDYVPKHLLPRLNGFELMMAPYAVAHMKLAMVLKDTSYSFASNERLNVYLTNTLEEPGNSDGQMSLFDDPIAGESIAANAVKKNNGINIVIGNPPYSSSSSNRGEWILNLISDYKRGLNEKKVNLDDDYIKFIRFGQFIVNKAGKGILAYITNNSFLDGITHREMRHQLMQVFNDIYIINLHGNSKRSEVAKDGSKDENVFDIQQGVSIIIGVIAPNKNKVEKVCYYDLYGTRDYKYKYLQEYDLPNINFELFSPAQPNYFFIPKNFSNQETYEKGFAIDELMPLGSSGIQTKNDKLAIQYKKGMVESIKQDFLNESKDALVMKYALKDSAGWKIDKAIKDIKVSHSSVERILYRPYDWRYVLYTNNSSGFLGRPREKVSRHFVGHDNYGLLVRRNTPPVDFSHVFICDSLISEGVLGIDPNGREYVFPLYIYPEEGSLFGRQVNFDEKIVDIISTNIGVHSVEPFDVLGYVYAVLHSKRYRNEFSEFLKINYPRIPYPHDKEYFYKLSKLGKQLIDIHLLRIEENNSNVSLIGEGDRRVDNPKYKNGCVFINSSQFFQPIPESYWNKTVGGYAPLQKWLKLRKGECLDDEDVSDYIKIVYSLEKTEELIDEIDRVFVLQCCF